MYLKPSPLSPSGPAQATDTAPRRIAIVANPGSGRRDPGLFDQICEALDRHGAQASLHVVKDGRSLTEVASEALEDDIDILAVGGGDGSIAGVTSVLFERQQQGHDVPPLGIIPLGTFNYVARSLNIPQDDPDAAARTLAQAPVRPLSIGEVNGHVFLNNASLGAYPAILDQREGIYRKWGRSRVAAYWSVLRALMTLGSPLSMKITVDGEPRRAKSPLAFVANSAYQIEEFDLPGADKVREGQFALYVAPDTGRYGLILRALRLAGRAARPGRDMELIHGREVKIETRQKKRLVARDGEKSEMNSPFCFTLHKDVLRVIAPETDQDPS